MLPLIQVCVVVATLAVVAIAVATVRAMAHVEKATDRFNQLAGDVRRWAVQANELTCETQEALASFRASVAPIGRVVERFEVLGERTADLSAAVLEEVEGPLRTAVAVAGGIRSVTAHLLKRFSHRHVDGRSATNGGSESE